MEATDESKEGTATATTAAPSTVQTTAACAASQVAPPQLFASPFLPEHECAIVAVLAWTHPLLILSRSTLTILMRFSDRLAHYLLHRAYHGLNGGMQSRLDSLVAAAPPSVTAVQSSAAVGSSSSSSSSAAPSSSSSSSVPDDAHSLHFAFDEPLWSALIVLEMLAHAEIAKAQTQTSEVGEAGSEPRAAREYQCMLPSVLADRWLQDFTLGLRLTDDDASLPSAMQSMRQKLTLCVIVEYILAELLDVGGAAVSDRQASALLPSDLWEAMEGDAEMRRLFAFLPLSWTIDTHGLKSPMHLACASQPLDAAQHSMRFLEPMFSAHSAAQAELDRSSWYHDPAAVIEAARMQAKGGLVEPAISRQLRQAHVRPLRFWGVDKSNRLPLSLQRACRDAKLVPDPRSNRECAYVSFAVSDASGREFHLLLRGHRGELPSVLCFVLRGDSLEHEGSIVLAASLRIEPSASGSPSARSLSLAIDPTCLVEFEPRGLSAVSTPAAAGASSTKRRMEPDHQQSEDNTAAASTSSSHAIKKSRRDEKGNSSQPTASSNADPSAASALSAASPSSSSSSAELHTEQRAEERQSLISAELEHAFRAAIPLLRFSLYGPSLFAANHPPAMRRLFTAHLIDSCLLESGLRPLPLVLSELISEFHSFDLPFRQDKAQEQTGRAGLQPRVQEPDKATYEGQLDSAAERACESEAQLNELFPVPVILNDEDDDEDDDDEGAESEAEDGAD